MARPALRIEVSAKDQKELRKLVSGGVEQVRVVLRALALLQLAKGIAAPRVYPRGRCSEMPVPQADRAMSAAFLRALQ
jgi:hypothetical protein